MEEILALLKNKEIEFKLIKHKQVYTMKDVIDISLEKYGCIPKNLFLKDKHNYYLITCQSDKKINLKELALLLNSKNLTFANTFELNYYLNVEKGSVSPLGLIYDQEKKVTFILDKDLLKEKRLGCHPNQNNMTIFLKISDLIKIIKNHGTKIIYIKI